MRFSAVVLLLGLALTAPVRAQVLGGNPHVDEGFVPGSCLACHRGHGVSFSPMLPSTQVELCLGCHGTRTERERQVHEGVVLPSMNPILLESVLQKSFTHPLNREVFSEHDSGVTCTSCHSPHRASAGRGTGQGSRRLSPKNPAKLELELCLSCHGNAAPGAVSTRPGDVGRLVRSRNPSYHPIEAPTTGRSPSVDPQLSGGEVNCTDCHGNDDPDGPRGPHGSNVPYLLRSTYETVDGAPESRRVYFLCYGCHQREVVLSETSSFPLHALHVVDVKASCATCHDPHGSEQHRGLIRFGDGRGPGFVSPSSSGVLRFESFSPGSGSCSLLCHGRDHDPEGYGIDAVAPGLTSGGLPKIR